MRLAAKVPLSLIFLVSRMDPGGESNVLISVTEMFCACTTAKFEPIRRAMPPNTGSVILRIAMIFGPGRSSDLVNSRAFLHSLVANWIAIVALMN